VRIKYNNTHQLCAVAKGNGFSNLELTGLRAEQDDFPVLYNCCTSEEWLGIKFLELWS